jgi:uncharacterized delta-60 repeat protein
MRYFQRTLRRVLLACGMIASATPAFAAPGDLDPGFASAGTLSADIGCSLSTSVLMSARMVRDAQGSLYLAGFCATGPANSGQGTSEIKVMKLDANGNRVTNFGNAGIATINTSNYDTANAVALDASGDLYIAGSSRALVNTQFQSVFAVWKLESGGGVLDMSFGTGGVRTINVGTNNYAKALVLDSNGNIYVAGESSVLDFTFAVAKLNSNGNPVSSFGSGGSTTISTGANTLSSVSALALDDAGHLYLAGESEPRDGSGTYDFAVAEINASNGSLVGGFGNAGVRTFDLGNHDDDFVNAMILDGSGNLYLAGSTSVAIDIDTSRFVAVVVKLSASTSALVPGFASGGIKTIDLTGDGSVAGDLALDGGGHLYVAGQQADIATLTSDLFVTKLDTNGNPVVDFGSNGNKMFTISGYDQADAMLLDGNGHLYLAGISENDDGTSNRTERVFLAARLFTSTHVSTTTLVSSLNPAAFGRTITFNATVTSSGATPSGNVTFYDGNAVICANVTLVGAHAACSSSTLAAGTSAHAVSAIYSGDGNNYGSISSVVEQVILGDEIFKNGFE